MRGMKRSIRDVGEWEELPGWEPVSRRRRADRDRDWPGVDRPGAAKHVDVDRRRGRGRTGRGRRRGVVALSEPVVRRRRL